MIRYATADDYPFILSGWSASLRSSRDFAFIEMDQWAALMRPVFERHLQRSLCLVDTGETDESRRGFIVYDAPRPGEYVDGPRGMEPDRGYVLYVYVAAPFRRWGVARGLFEAAGISLDSRFHYAVRTKASWECKGKIRAAVFNPYRARFKKEATA